jgi:hypothetical protein
VTASSLAQSELKELLHYDPDTGIFTRAKPMGRFNRYKIGSEIGTHHEGYKRIFLFKRQYYAHQLAWLYIHGVWPSSEIDHINIVKHDNRIINLRLVTRSQNIQNIGLQSNNTSGFKGVSWWANRWHAQITVNLKQIHLGAFINLDDAVAARKQAEEQLHTHRIVA